jgi:hypothetical protein
MEQHKKRITLLSNLGYVIGCVILFLVAIAIIIASVFSIIHDLFSGDFTVYKLLDEVGLLVFSIAVIDVSKYLMIEEVLRGTQERRPREVRQALTKFAVIIASALSLEGLVLTIEVSKNDVTEILYPVSVLVTAILFIVGIGIYQRFNALAEKNH